MPHTYVVAASHKLGRERSFRMPAMPAAHLRRLRELSAQAERLRDRAKVLCAELDKRITQSEAITTPATRARKRPRTKSGQGHK